jgi:hypothetical protein
MTGANVTQRLVSDRHIPPEVHWYIMAPFNQAVAVRLSSSDPSGTGTSPEVTPTGAVYEGAIDPTWNIGKWVYASTIEA